MNTNKPDYSKSTHRKNYDNYIGATFGRWTIIEVLPTFSCNGSVLCKVRCSCDKHTEKVVPLYTLKNGTSKSCGCLAKELTSSRNLKDITGMKFNHLTVLYKTDKKYNDGSPLWHCQCDCGKFRDVSSHLLKNGAIRSCEDCSRNAKIAGVKLKNTKYDDFGRTIAHVFNTMKQRCCNPNDPDYPRYGAKGIDIEQDWLDHIEHFVEWAKKTGYRSGMTIERNDGTKGYHPWNCSWKDRTDQQNNLKSNHVINVDGRRFTLTQCVRMVGSENPHIDRVFKSDKEAEDSVRRILADRASKNLPDPIEAMSQKRELQRHIDKYPFVIG